MIEPLRTSFEVARPADQVFRTWTVNFAQWWPASRSVTGEAKVQVVFEPWLGGDRLGAEGPGWREANKAGWGGLVPHVIHACAESKKTSS